MCAFDTYRKATVYLPKEDGDRKIPHVGQWRMVIRGETSNGRADYHAMIIGEDREIKAVFDYPRKLYAVGDLVPLRVRVAENNGKHALKFSDIHMEVTEPRVPLAELLQRLRMSSFELNRMMAGRGGGAESVEARLYAKLRALERAPSMRESLKPARRSLSLREGTLQCEFSDGAATIPYAIQKPGLHGFRITAWLEGRESGPVCRTDYLSLVAEPGSPDKSKSSVVVSRLKEEKFTGFVAMLTPRNEKGNLIGPGRAKDITVLVGGKAGASSVEDQLDGSYRVEIPEKGKEPKGSIAVRMGNVTLWEESI
jgi:hypothetical protein